MHYDEFRFNDICKARCLFPAPDTVAEKGRTKCGSKNLFFAGALYRKLPIVCVAFLFEPVTSCSASKCPYYQKGVNASSKVIVCCFRLLVIKLSDAFRSVLIASSFRWALKNVLACRIYDIISSSSVIWLYRLVRTLTAWTGVPEQLHSLKGGVVSQTPKPRRGGPENLLSGLLYLSRECLVLRRQVFSLTHPLTGRIWCLQRQF